MSLYLKLHESVTKGGPKPGVSNIRPESAKQKHQSSPLDGFVNVKENRNFFLPIKTPPMGIHVTPK